MKQETIAVHGGYEFEPTTKAVAVPIYQTVAYAFDSADHAAALFNLEAEGFRYTRIQNPTTAGAGAPRSPLSKPGLEAMCVSSGQAAVNYAILNVADWAAILFHPSALRHHAHVVRAYPAQPGNQAFASLRPTIQKQSTGRSTMILERCSVKVSAIPPGTSAISRNCQRSAQTRSAAHCR